MSHERLDKDLRESWEDAGGSSHVGTAIEIDALMEAGIERATRSSPPPTVSDNTNLVIAQIAQNASDVPKVLVRVMDPRRAEWYAEQGLQTICPTQVAIRMFEQAVLGDTVEAG